MQGDDLADWDATETAAAIRKGTVSALEAVDAAIARAEAMDPRLNFLVARDFDRARDRARGPLGDGPFAGVPFLIKDLDDFAGLPTRLGTRRAGATCGSRRRAMVTPCGSRCRIRAAGSRPTTRRVCSSRS